MAKTSFLPLGFEQNRITIQNFETRDRKWGTGSETALHIAKREVAFSKRSQIEVAEWE